LFALKRLEEKIIVSVIVPTVLVETETWVGGSRGVWKLFLGIEVGFVLWHAYYSASI